MLGVLFRGVKQSVKCVGAGVKYVKERVGATAATIEEHKITSKISRRLCNIATVSIRIMPTTKWPTD